MTNGEATAALVASFGNVKLHEGIEWCRLVAVTLTREVLQPVVHFLTCDM